MFTLGENTGYPVYYKQFIGSTPDVVAFKNLIEDTNKYHHDCTIIADKGFASKDDFTILDELNLKYVIPLRRGNLFSKTHVPTSITGYDNVFAYN